MTRGRFITLEGGEGAGKTSALSTIRVWLEGHGRQVVMSREPGGTPAAEQIREMLLDPGGAPLAPLSELLLMFAARNENLEQVIRPALAAGKDVICDRFTDASHAYQGAGRGLGHPVVDRLAAIVQGDLEPDLTLLLDIPVETGLARIQQRDQSPDRMEQNKPEFLERVRQNYLERARCYPERIVIIDARPDWSEVQAAIVVALEERLQ